MTKDRYRTARARGQKTSKARHNPALTANANKPIMYVIETHPIMIQQITSSIVLTPQDTTSSKSREVFICKS